MTLVLFRTHAPILCPAPSCSPRTCLRKSTRATRRNQNIRFSVSLRDVSTSNHWRQFRHWVCEKCRGPGKLYPRHSQWLQEICAILFVKCEGRDRIAAAKPAHKVSTQLPLNMLRLIRIHLPNLCDV